MKILKSVFCIAVALTAAALLLSTPATAQQVFTTDVVIQGSLCVGFDCPSSISFGFDTLRLQENNLRIHFDDTSGSASFPNNDWRIIVNDSTNGGLNHFTINDATAGRNPFRIEAGATNNSLYIEADGDIGINTSDPVVELHIVDGDSPTVRLEQDGSSGFTPQTWDLAGNETNFFVRDVTNGSKLPFKIKPNAPDNSVFIEGTTGDVGIGTDAPGEPLHIRRTSQSQATLHLEDTRDANVDVRIQNADGTWTWRNNTQGRMLVNAVTTGSSNNIVTFFDNLGVTTNRVADFKGEVQSNGVALTSSRELKTGFEPVDTTALLAKMEQLGVQRWQFKNDPSAARHIGPMAEDFKALFDLPGSGKTISVTDANGVAFAAIQGLIGQNRQLESSNKQLEERVAALEAAIQKLAGQ